MRKVEEKYKKKGKANAKVEKLQWEIDFKKEDEKEILVDKIVAK